MNMSLPGYPKEISISMGIHIDNRPEISFTELYNKVDIALYNAKNTMDEIVMSITMKV